MQVSLNWLNEFVDLSDIEVEQIAHELTMSGLEVEAVEESRWVLQSAVSDMSSHTVLILPQRSVLEEHTDRDQSEHHNSIHLRWFQSSTVSLYYPSTTGECGQ